MLDESHFKHYTSVNDNYIRLLNFIIAEINPRTTLDVFLEKYTITSTSLVGNAHKDKYLDTYAICDKINAILNAMPVDKYIIYGIEKKENATQTWLVLNGMVFLIRQKKLVEVQENIRKLLKKKRIDNYEYLQIPHWFEGADTPLSPRVWVRPGGNEGHYVHVSDEKDTVLSLKTFAGFDDALKIANAITKYLWEN